MVWAFIILTIVVLIASFISIKLIRRELQKVVIPFNTDFTRRKHIIIQCASSGTNLYFIVDTGCTATQIKQESLNRLEYKKCRRKVTTYGVKGEGYTSILRSIEIEIEGYTFEVFCYTSNEKFNFPDGTDGLLGSDFLDRYGWVIDYKHKCIVIK